MTASRPKGAPLLVSTPADDPPQHDGDRFRNHYVGFEPKSLAEVLRWRIDAARHGLPPPPRAPTPRVAPDLAFLRANATAGKAMTPALTWIGHASVLAQIGGLNLLIDPVFSERDSPLTFAGPRRQAAPGLALADLPPIDAVLISHNHYDHLDLETVRPSPREQARDRPSSCRSASRHGSRRTASPVPSSSTGGSRAGSATPRSCWHRRSTGPDAASPTA